MSFLRKLVHHPHLATILWCIVILAVFVKHNFLTDFPNNYIIFKHTYIHAVEERSLYGRYPDEYNDKNLYGPVFSVLFAPFTILPDWAGHLLFVTASVLLLAAAIRWLPLLAWQKNAIMLICLNELLTAGFNVQFNIATAALLVLSFGCIWYQKEIMAGLTIATGTLVKLYGVVALAFFFHIKNKWKFIAAGLFWAVVLFALPMMLSSPGYVINMYTEWYEHLVIRSAENVSLTGWQDISIPGFVRRLFGNSSIPNTPFLVAGAVLFALPYLRVSKYREPAFQFLLLSSVLMFPVLFSPASESSTYIIVFVGIAVWAVIQPKPMSAVVLGLLIFAFVLGSLNTTDIYPHSWRTFLRLHAVKALPCTVIWLRVIYEMLTSDFKNYRVPAVTPI